MKQITTWFGTLEQHMAGGNMEEAPVLLSSQLVQKQGCSQYRCPLWFEERCGTFLWVSKGSLPPLYNHNIIMPTTSIDLFAALPLEQPNVSSGRALAKTDMMTPIRLHWYSKHTMDLCGVGYSLGLIWLMVTLGNLSSCSAVPEVPQCQAN